MDTLTRDVGPTEERVYMLGEEDYSSINSKILD